MRLWLNRNGPVSLREQLITQVVLGILCRELAPGQRLPSTRELSRRFGIHANTASAAYRQLETDGWVELRHGSGVFVRTARPDLPLTPELAVDQLIGDLAVKARKLGASDSLVRARLRRWLAAEAPARWLLIEPDPELRRIAICEMAQALALPVIGCNPDDCSRCESLDGCLPVVMPSKAAAVRKLLPAGTDTTVLRIHPVAPTLDGYLPAPAAVLVGIASRWSEFQRIAKTMLIAVGLAPESLLVRNVARPGWKRGLESATVVVCDVATEPELPPKCHPIVFRLIGEDMLAELRATESQLIDNSASQSVVV
jgi:GntR family transcriptional regulator